MKIETSLAESEPWLPETIRFEKQFHGSEINEFMLLFFAALKLALSCPAISALSARLRNPNLFREAL